MHSRKGGKSKSVKPDREGVPEWVPYSKQEVEEIILKLFKEGNNPSRIGLLLRDQYGVPDVRPIMGMKLTHVLEKNNVGLKLPEDLQNIINKSVALRSHLDKHKKDTHNRRSMNLWSRRLGGSANTTYVPASCRRIGATTRNRQDCWFQNELSR